MSRILFHPDSRLRPKKWSGQDFDFADAKMDGIRLTLYRELDGSTRALSRKPDINLWHKLPESLVRIAKEVPPGTVVDGELFLPGKPATAVVTALKSASEELVFSAFALPRFKGADWTRLPIKTARDVLESELGFHLTELWEGELCEKKLLEVAEQRGAEGWILKQGHYFGWYKIKVRQTIDCVVMGTQDGKHGKTGRLVGKIGSFDVGVNVDGKLVEIANVGGLTDEVRDLDPKACIGRVVEVAYDEIAAKGRLKFPRFVRWRDDKEAHECTKDQL